MSSLKADFNELMERIKAGRDFGHASFEPIFYLVFSPASILEVKRQMPAWEAKLRNDGWSVHKFSIAEEIQKILDAAPLKKIWIAADSKAPLQWEKTNKALANALTNGSLQERSGSRAARTRRSAQYHFVSDGCGGATPLYAHWLN